MKSLSLLQKIAVYTGLISALTFGAYKCGPDDTQPDTTEDAQVEVDAGNHFQDGGLKDKLVYPDANGDKEPNGDKDVPDGGVDASDVDITDTYDGGDLTDVLDGGYDASDTGGDGGQVKAILKYLVNQNSSNPADYQYEPRIIDINVGDYVFYSACDSEGIDSSIFGYRITDTVGTVATDINCIMGNIFYNKKGLNIETTLNLVNSNLENVGLSDIMVINIK